MNRRSSKRNSLTSNDTLNKRKSISNIQTNENNTENSEEITNFKYSEKEHQLEKLRETLNNYKEDHPSENTNSFNRSDTMASGSGNRNNGK